MGVRVLDTVTGRTLEFPMMPDKISLKCGSLFIDYDLIKTGKASMPSGSELSEINFNGVLPGDKRQGHGWIRNWTSPREIQSLWSIWRTMGRKLRITIDGTPIDHGVYLQSYEMEYSGGFGDYTYAIAFIEARDVEVNVEAVIPEYTTSSNNNGQSTSAKRYVTVTGSRVNVRRSASTSGKIAFVANKGDKYEYAGEKPGNWYAITVNGEKLYISSKYSSLGAETSNSSTSSSSGSSNRTYTVKKGDTLWGIAQKFYGKGSEYTRIKTANNITGSLRAGMVLRIP